MSLTAVTLVIPDFDIDGNLISIDVSGSAIVAGTANLDVAASKLEILSKVQSLTDAACTYIKSKCILGPSVIQ